MSETSQITNPLVKLLTAHGAWCWRANSGSFLRNVKGNPSGTPDILGVLSNGVLFGIETKVPGNKQSKSQIDWEIKATRRGVRHAVAESVQQGFAFWKLWEQECQSSKPLPTACSNCVHSASTGSLPSTGKSVGNASPECAPKTLRSRQEQRQPRSRNDTLPSIYDVKPK